MSQHYHEIRERTPIGGHPSGYDYRIKLPPQILQDIQKLVNTGRTAHLLSSLINILYESKNITIPEIELILKEALAR